MNARAYKLIFILLSGSVLSILALQGFWIRNFYLQKKEEFDRNVYAVLDQLREKLQERKHLQSLKMTYIIQDGDTIVKTPSQKFSIASEGYVQIVNSHAEVITKEVNILKKRGGPEDSIHIRGDEKSVFILPYRKETRVTVINDQKKQSQDDGIQDGEKLAGNAEEMTKLVDKMLTEIKVMDTETENADSLKVLIKRTLNSKGLFLPFAFSIQKPAAGRNQVVVKSPGFSETLNSYKSDLSAGNVINTHDFLLLQFPERDDVVMAGMKNSILLSLAFSLCIIGVFYYVIRLIRRQKKLSDIKNDFVNNMTHELKTPIATISLALDAIHNPLVKNDEDKFREYGRILKEENQKLNTHVERVLQLALLDNGKLRLINKPLDLKALLNGVTYSYRLQIAEQKAEVSLDFPREPTIMDGDAQHLKTVFGNLLDNALKYSGDLCVIAIAIKKSAEEIAIHFRDKGIGIDKPHTEKVFDKFYRVQGGNLHDVKGFGLGLSYVRSIVEAHGGTIELKSELGSGSEFIIRFKTV